MLSKKYFATKKKLLSKKFFTVKKVLLSKNIFAFKKTFLLSKKFLLLKKIFFFDYNLIILKEIVIMAGILNHTIVDFIEKKTSDDVNKKLCWHFPFQLCHKIYNFSQHDD